MKNRLVLSAIASALLLAGCGDAETNIVELDPIEVPEDDHDHDGHDHDDDHDSDYEIESEGRLVVADAASNTLTVFDLDDNSVLDTFSATFDGSSVSASADYRFAVINSRANGLTEFLDGGLWREDHVEHLHDYEEAPSLSGFTLEGSQPTHVVTQDGQLAVFYDGNADTSMPAAVKVVTDTQIASE
ncbi:MAG: 5-methyltetrahydrofolate--homocysteine methyltransferase, partial [Pseudomonadota bacterium]|nr:5-methyltetrahydrofolate--homocysteine methyltransferase [Pseudomonadota bacterium]